MHDQEPLTAREIVTELIGAALLLGGSFAIFLYLFSVA